MWSCLGLKNVLFLVVQGPSSQKLSSRMHGIGGWQDPPRLSAVVRCGKDCSLKTSGVKASAWRPSGHNVSPASSLRCEKRLQPRTTPPWERCSLLPLSLVEYRTECRRLMMQFLRAKQVDQIRSCAGSAGMAVSTPQEIPASAD